MHKSKRFRILFVAMSESVHFARWLRQLEGLGWEIHLVPCEWPSKLYPSITEITLHGVGWFRPAGLPESVQTPMPLWLPANGSYRVHQWGCRWLPELLSMPRQLASVIQKVRPHVVHALEMQHSGYLVSDALGLLSSGKSNHNPPLIYSSWGSDLYYFGKDPDHSCRIKKVLQSADYIMTDCQRDITLANQFGFTGECLGVFPGPGGYQTSAMRKMGENSHPSSRRVIMVKGQQNWAGRALIALAAIQKCAEKLAGYEIVVYYTNDIVQAVVQHMQRTTSLNIKALIGHQPHDEIIRLMGKSRIALGLAVTDGVPNAMLEAMVMGAFPIQSDTGATGEWIEDGRNGLMVQPEDVAGVEAALRRALSDDVLVDSVAVINRRLTDERIDESVVRPRVIAAYERVMGKTV